MASTTPSLEDLSAEGAHMSLDVNAPNVPSVRVLRRRVISEEDPEDGEAGDPDEEGEEDIDQLVEEDEEEYGNHDGYMDVDDDSMNVRSD